MTNLVSTRRISQTATALIATAIVGGAFVGGLPGVGSTVPVSTQSSRDSADRCEGGTDVSSFVCRNTWMAHSKLSAR